MRKFTKMACTFAVAITLVAHLRAQTFTKLVDFDGSAPFSGVIQGVNGNFYGVTAGNGFASFGGAYQVTPSGTLTQFGTGNGYDPFGSLVLATNGSFYGTNNQGGGANEGTVFKLTSTGTATTVYNFCMTTCTDGTNPGSGLVQAGSADLYGTTLGTAFKMTLGGALTTLYTFCTLPKCADGQSPSAYLTHGTDGNFYGTTAQGGANGFGTIFKITPVGTMTILHNFTGKDGSGGGGAMVEGTDFLLYGVAATGGNTCSTVYGSCGTIFRITKQGKFKLLHKFTGSDGGNPVGGMVLGTDGNFYGTASQGGANQSGTIFQMTTAGSVTTLYNFCSQQFCLDGVRPLGALLEATDGSLYGTAEEGGEQTDGTFFSFSLGLPHFAKIIPTSGKTATNVVILGNGLTGATGISFNGTPAAFTVVSDTEITTSVPSGATTGTVSVTTSSGTLNSNVRFQLIP